MSIHVYSSSLVLVCLVTGALWAADDPFCGKWKLNQEKSKNSGRATENRGSR